MNTVTSTVTDSATPASKYTPYTRDFTSYSSQNLNPKTREKQLSHLKKTREKQLVVDNLIKIIEKEYQKGNSSISQEKIQFLLEYKKQQEQKDKQESIPTTQQQQQQQKPALPAPLYAPLFNKFTLPQSKQRKTPAKCTSAAPRRRKEPITFKKIEHLVITLLESLANVLDNLHLFSKFPMFPQKLVELLKQTNKLWVIILIFLIRKTISQLLNVIRKENKVKVELNILRSNKNSKLLEQDEGHEENEPFIRSASKQAPGSAHHHHRPGGSGVLRKYEKVLKDLKFDKMMLIIELVGNFLDLSFNFIELYEWAVPSWFMNTLNMASMAMTIYRMNKDDEYVDDDITEELI